MSDWDRTKISKARLANQINQIDGIDYFKGHHMIARDTPLHGGVYTGKSQRAAVTVDIYSPKINELYEAVKEGVRKTTSDIFSGREISHFDSTGKEIFEEDAILSNIYLIVKNAMPVKRENEINIEYLVNQLGAKQDGLVPLDTFIENKVGLCSEYSLVSGAILERFKKEGHIKGKISVDRNSTEMGGHCWCRYTDEKNKVWILDVTLGYLGGMDAIPKKDRWAYERPELM